MVALSTYSVGLQCLHAVDIGNTGLRHRVCERVFVQADREFGPVLRSEAGLSAPYDLLDVVGFLAWCPAKDDMPVEYLRGEVGWAGLWRVSDLGLCWRGWSVCWRGRRCWVMESGRSGVHRLAVGLMSRRL